MAVSNILKKVVKTYSHASLILRIVIGLAVGIVLALLFPGASWIGVFGDLFVGALKALAPVLVFVLVLSALAQGRSRLDSRFGLVIWLYLLTTFLASRQVFCFRSGLYWPMPLSLKRFRRASERL